MQRNLNNTANTLQNNVAPSERRGSLLTIPSQSNVTEGDAQKS